MKIADAHANNFTALRLLLALLVVFAHFRLLAGVVSPAWPFSYGTDAVECFFVVSGYLAAGSYDRDSHLLRFYTRRLFRIYPLYIAVIILQTGILLVLQPGGWLANADGIGRYFVANAVFANFLQHDAGDSVLAGLAVPGLNPSLWTLKIEVAFYAILPGIWLAAKKWGVPFLVAMFIGSAIYYETLRGRGMYDLAKQLPGQLQFFAVGMGFHWLGQRVRLPRWQGIVAVVAAGLMLTLLPSHPPVLYPLAIGLFVWGVAWHLPPIPMRLDISYGVYLLHGPVIQLSLLLGLYRPDWLGLAAVLGVVIALALITEKLIEAPGIGAGKALCRQLGRLPTPQLARQEISR